MNKRIIALLLVAVLAVSLLAACGKKEGFISVEEAQKIAAEAAGISRKDLADIHPHTGEVEGVPHYNIHLTLKDGTEYNVIINALTGEVVEIS